MTRQAETQPTAPPRSVLNTHDQLVAAGGGIAITKAYQPGRERRVSGWSVYRVSAQGRQLVTDPKAAWYDYGCKVFLKGPHQDALAVAQAWIAAQYGEPGPWKRNRYGDYLPERIHRAHPLAPLKGKA